jgi:regulator of replication initiation timing
MIDFSRFGSKITSAYELAKRLGNSELALEISDLQMELANLKSDYADLINENTALKTEIISLKDQLAGKNKGGITFAPVLKS